MTKHLFLGFIFFAIILNFLSQLASGEYERIIGGKEADEKQAQYMAFVMLDRKTHCGGVIWNEDTILTAAQCVMEKESTTLLDPKSLSVFVGNLNITGKAQATLPSYLFTVAKTIPHKYFVPNIYKNDIALLRLSKKIDFTGVNKKAGCICDPEPLEKLNISECTALGWGQSMADDPNSFVSTLQQVNMPIQNESFCVERGNYYSSHWAFCAGERSGGRNTCNGDAGGPVVCKTLGGSNGEDVWSLAGLTSYGTRGCDAVNTPRYYTRIDRFIDWIKEQSGENE